MIAIPEGQIWNSYRESFTYILNLPSKKRRQIEEK